MRWRLGVIGSAAALAVLPLPADWVESVYSNGAYPRLQSVLTSWSNTSTVAWFDVLLAVVATAWVALAWRDLRRTHWLRACGRVGLRTATLGSVLYLLFVATWGLNYQRVPLEEKLAIDYRAATPDATEALARTAVRALNRLHPLPRPDLPSWPAQPEPSLVAAFGAAQRELGSTGVFRPARPKWTVLDAYFRVASVDGMTDPFFLETLTLSRLLPMERPMVMAHEWAHLAGYADEGEASFVGWLACTNGDAVAQYSAWLFLYSEAVVGLGVPGRQRVSAELAAGPRADLAAIARRIRSDVSPLVSAMGWGVYDQYLKANGVERGRESYTDVVRLVLGTRIGARRAGADPARSSGVGVATGVSSGSP